MRIDLTYIEKDRVDSSPYHILCGFNIPGKFLCDPQKMEFITEVLDTPLSVMIQNERLDRIEEAISDIKEVFGEKDLKDWLDGYKESK